ncbi:Asp-tRNA(Asn)/Glu-tRNA(Gln) amidotransferase subunit GatC [Sulfurovum sp.]|jgi:aspartyl-tRNA(Asn)/glutamyl-tRNA(Gln) amidotransferase subunit C|uniref:Asp-tRNA(Asn)/Glu-tRNA(Gln) amidotransferase subunit GatC n=1 Tax=Sulfurovum sp. TaxID=1969726 RepID=UPI002A36F73F|nr:Asp-tRNA(Asn)/Glu-tRNA(Gln) amidotransferase subunit GatC [Sulfurovum sp.]MDD2451278.1 Asp-tRNA(Asn)/Glu-tRNA(Gln) amidotransferase subunit GatC [Sulfurovum sp.]MDD3499578.1 Asp-tRNA(Asn)/Glu-tRNA(Gln) amidotransferase subunit GatC [Sulfurovum sp.]MDY0403227.1 Asp-tRNA(Asn)/Glu-tRNA(Gln) amidotransferase subunit GatC [Sulfurovum sp.]
MQIDDKVLANLEKLSHLRIDESKKEAVKKQLTEILAYVDNLNELDTANLSATFSTLEGGTPMREDLPQSDESVAKDILRHAPNAKDDFFIVPAIIE